MLPEKIELLANQADTVATRTSGGFMAYGRGLRLRLETANKVGTTATYEMQVQVQYPDGDFVAVWTAAATVTANGNATYVLYPGAASAGGSTETVQVPVSGAFRVVLTVANADASNNMDTKVEAWVLV